MSSENVDYELQNTEFRASSTTPVLVLNVKDATYGKRCILMYVNGDPATYAVAGKGFTTQFSLGCIAIDTTNGVIKVNSNATAPSWTAQV